MTKKKNDKNKPKKQVFNAVRYDGAMPTHDFRSSWGMADSRSINASGDKTTRETLRNRARQCVANQAFAHGAGAILSQLVVGSCMPRLQLTYDGMGDKSKQEYATFIEEEFALFCERINLAKKLRALRFTRFVDGESFGVIHSDKSVPSSEVQLNFTTIDSARVSCFGAREIEWSIGNPYNEDGILFNFYNEPIKYRILNNNPGDTINYDYTASTIFNASNVVHYYDQKFSEQRRGVSELAPVLMLLTQLDSYSKSVVKAANVAADLALMFKMDDSDVDLGDPMAPLDFDRGTAFAVPAGCTCEQLKSEQPTSTYSPFVEELLTQICTGLQIPKALFSAANYNFSSAKLDLSKFEARIRFERNDLVETVIKPIWREWYKEFSIMYEIPEPLAYKPEFMFTSAIGGSLDEVKEANAAGTRLASGISTYAEEYARRGMDWEKAIEQRFKEAALIESLSKKYGGINPFDVSK